MIFELEIIIKNLQLLLFQESSENMKLARGSAQFTSFLFKINP